MSNVDLPKLDPVECLCRLAAWGDDELDIDAVLRFPPNVFERCLALGLLAESPPVLTGFCPVCKDSYGKWLAEMHEEGYTEDPERDWHSASFEVERGADGEVVRATAHCSEGRGSTDVPFSSIQRWRVDRRAVAGVIAGLCGFGGSPVEVPGGRVFRLASLKDGRTLRDVYLVREVDSRDGVADVRLTAQESHHRPRTLVVAQGQLLEDVDDELRFLALAQRFEWSGTDFVAPGGNRTLADAPAAPSGKNRSCRAQGLSPVEVPAGTRWEAIRIRIGTDQLCVTVGDQHAWREYDAAGFASHQRSSENPAPISAWSLLRQFARSDPANPSRSIVTEVPSRPGVVANDARIRAYDRLKQQVAGLRKLLRALIPGIETDPIQAIRDPSLPSRGTGPYEVNGHDAVEDDQSDDPGWRSKARSDAPKSAMRRVEYRTQFYISELPQEFVQTPSGAGWSSVSMFHVGPCLTVRVSCATSPRDGAGTIGRIDPLYAQLATTAGTSQPAVVVSEGGCEEEFDLDQLDWEHAEVEALRQLLSEGHLPRPESDRTALGLRRRLHEMVGVGGDAIVYRKVEKRWVATFAIGS